MQSKFSILSDPPASQPARRGAVRPAGLARLRETVERGRMDGRGAERRGAVKKDTMIAPYLSLAWGAAAAVNPFPSLPLSCSKRGPFVRFGQKKGYVSKPSPTPMIRHLGFMIQRMKMVHSLTISLSKNCFPSANPTALKDKMHSCK